MSDPIRTCLGCRGTAPKAQLLRLAWYRGEVVIDERQVLPGRGAYLHRGCVGPALKRRQFGRALRQPVAADQVAARLSELAD